MATYNGSDRTATQGNPGEGDLAAVSDPRLGPPRDFVPLTAASELRAFPVRGMAQMLYSAGTPALWRAIVMGSPVYQEGSAPSGSNPVILGD